MTLKHINTAAPRYPTLIDSVRLTAYVRPSAQLLIKLGSDKICFTRRWRWHTWIVVWYKQLDTCLVLQTYGRIKGDLYGYDEDGTIRCLPINRWCFLILNSESSPQEGYHKVSPHFRCLMSLSESKAGISRKSLRPAIPAENTESAVHLRDFAYLWCCPVFRPLKSRSCRAHDEV